MGSDETAKQWTVLKGKLILKSAWETCTQIDNSFFFCICNIFGTCFLPTKVSSSVFQNAIASWKPKVDFNSSSALLFLDQTRNPMNDIIKRLFDSITNEMTVLEQCPNVGLIHLCFPV